MTPYTKQQPSGRHHGVYVNGKPMASQQRQNVTFDALSKEAFPSSRVNSFHLTRHRLSYLHLKDFSNYECESYLKQPLIPSWPKVVVAYCTFKSHTCHWNWPMVNDLNPQSQWIMPLLLLQCSWKRGKLCALSTVPSPTPFEIGNYKVVWGYNYSTTLRTFIKYAKYP